MISCIPFGQGGAYGRRNPCARIRACLAFCRQEWYADKLVNWSPEQIREEVLRLRDVFGGNLIVSASHEEILPNIPIENMIAMARAAKE